MTYFIISIFAFLFGVWVKVSGEAVNLELGHYTISIDLYFIILSCVAILFLLVTFIRLFYSVSSALVSIKNRRKDREEALVFETFLSIDLDDIKNTQKLVKNLNDRSLLVQIFYAGKTGNYSFFSNNIVSLNLNSALLLSYKLIMHLKGDKIAFQKFIDYCSSSINNKTLLLPFQIESFILKNDWQSAAAKLKEAVKSNIFLPFDYNEMLAVLYCALAKEYGEKGNYKDAIKFLFKAQNHCANFRPINYLKAEFYSKLGKIRKACTILEIEYEANPTPQAARLYMSLNGNNAEKLCNLRPDYYFSYCILAMSAINSGKYDLALQHLNNAMTKANYLSIYLIMIQLSQERNEVAYWLNQIYSKSLPDPGWKCQSCSNELRQWNYWCSHCGDFNSVTLK
ncbi:MAG: heme biosynthesis protein HemY [Wolbachia endosymbiont of Tyrophagus putrescentiae]|nr:heme biosynthesis protein HemY [Wolbachia endosymbiont of Tyrophagus putrescentiae]